MKPKPEDVLFISKTCKHKIEYENQVMNVLYDKMLSGKTSSIELDEDEFCPLVRISQETLENLIRDELKEKYYPGFVKYFKSNAKDCVLKSAKNSKKSLEARIKGNTLFAKKKHNADVHKAIWELYSTSIALAPAGSKDLILAYESRSNLLLHFKKYEDCIKDIDRALSITEFDLLKVKLLCRKMTCFVAMNKSVEEKEHLWIILKGHFEKIDGAFKNENFLKMMKQAKNDAFIKPDEKIKDEQECFSLTATFSNITIRHNKERHITVNRDFKVGETVLVTKPTIASVNPNQFYAYCSFCLSFMWAGIPCDQCSLCMYCSEDCKEKAWEKYHILECKVNPHIDFDHAIYFDFTVSVKIFLMGVREFGSVPKLLEKVREAELLQDDPQITKIDELHESKFLNVYTLPNKRNSDSCTLSNLVKNTCFLMAYLTQTLSDIFGKEVGTMKGKELAKDEDFVYSTYVLLKIMMLCGLHMQFPSVRKTHSNKCPRYESRDECLKKRCCSLGSIFHYFKGLIEKSCNPNVSHCQTQDGKTIYFCTQPIKKMEKITAALTVPFYRYDRIERLNKIPCAQAQSLYELCQCIACEKNWPPVILEMGKFQWKFYRRTLIVKTEGTELTQKYLSRFASMVHDISDVIKYYTFNQDEFQELARDTHTVISTCGQPSFASSWMNMTFWRAYENLYADISVQLRVPEDC